MAPPPPSAVMNPTNDLHNMSSVITSSYSHSRCGSAVSSESTFSRDASVPRSSVNSRDSATTDTTDTTTIITSNIYKNFVNVSTTSLSSEAENSDEEDVVSVSSSTEGSVVSKVTSFNTLVEDIRAILGPSSGIDSDDVDVTSLMESMRAYDPAVNSHEWEKYALCDLSRGYTRNGVDECNKKANLLILVWNPSNGSLVHDHANAHCVMKILKGTLCETRYDWPKDYSSDSEYSPNCGLNVSKVTELKAGEVAYMSDQLGLHRMYNPNPNEVAISLHLYTPPYAAKFGCHTFDEQTGKSTYVPMSSLYSDQGVILDACASTC